MKNIKSPIFAKWVLKRLLFNDEHNEVVGDFEEAYKIKYLKSGFLFANLWYWLQLLKALPEIFINRMYWSNIMFNNYLKIALRNYYRNKSYTFINVFGLSFGIVSCILILMYVNFELSYDDYNVKADRIYRIGMERTYPDKVRNWGWTAPIMAPTVSRDYEEVESAVRLYRRTSGSQVSYGDKSILENNILYTDSSFFNIFSVKLLVGDPNTSLEKPQSVILSDNAAKKYFGDEDPLGKSIIIGQTSNPNSSFIVTGVSENIPDNSHFHYDFLLSFNSIAFMSSNEDWAALWRVWTYVLLNDGYTVDNFENRLQGILPKYLGPQLATIFSTTYEEFLKAGNGYRLFLQPLTDIHLKSSLEQELELNGNISYVYIFSVVALFILVIACINFMNLSTAKSAKRSREVGVRKALGSYRKQLIGQFLFESMLLSFISLIFALLIVELSLPWFSEITDRTLATNYFGNPFIIPGLISFAFLVGLISGSYPAFFLSAFNPVSALKGPKIIGSGGHLIRNSMVIFQFSISITLIIGTLIVKDQLDFLMNKDLGYETDHVVVIENARNLGTKVDIFKNELLKYSNIISASGSFVYPGNARDGVTWYEIGKPLDTAVSLSNVFADYDFISTLGMKITEGRYFSKEFASDTTAVVINESAVRSLGLIDPIGKLLTSSDDSWKVVGVIKDFHFKSLHSDITPLRIELSARGASFVSVRIKNENITETISIIEKTWNVMSGNMPITFSFLDENVSKIYQNEEKTGQISRIFSIVAIVIGCLGLFGLAAFTAEQRTKEIGVRKVLGASELGIVGLLSKDFTKWVLISNIIAWPISYYAANKWLNSFAYNTGIDLSAFIYAGGAAFAIAIFTVVFQAIKAAKTDPILSLKNE